MSHAALLAGYANPMIVCDSADFDGTNDWVSRGAGLTGAADSKTGIFSAWVRIDGGDGALRYIIGTEGAPTFDVLVQTDNKLYLRGANTGNINDRLAINSTTAYTAGATWLACRLYFLC